eukprot:COSAG05_NODE_2643_length_2810_cov_83.834747_1_plen_62_part_00
MNIDSYMAYSENVSMGVELTESPLYQPTSTVYIILYIYIIIYIYISMCWVKKGGSGPLGSK